MDKKYIFNTLSSPDSWCSIQFELNNLPTYKFAKYTQYIGNVIKYVMYIYIFNLASEF